MANSTTTTVVQSLFERRLKTMRDVFSRNNVLGAMFVERLGEETNVPVTTNSNAQVRIPFRTGPIASMAGVKGAEGAFATPTAPTITHGNITCYPLTFTGRYGDIDEMCNSVGQVRSYLTQIMDAIAEGMALNLNNMWWGTGNGVLGRINGAPSGTTVVLDAATPGAAGNGVIGIMKGHVLQASSTLTGTIPDRAIKGHVASKVDSTYTLTMVENATLHGWQDNDYILIEDGLNNVPYGILAVDDTFLDTYMGISRATNLEFKPLRSTSIAAANLQITIVNLLMQAQHEGRPVPDVGITRYDVLSKIWQEAKANIRFTNPVNAGGTKPKFALGFESTPITSPAGSVVDIYLDSYTPGTTAGSDGMFALLRREDWFVARSAQRQPGWYKDHGSIPHTIPGTFGKVVCWLDIHNLICEDPRGTIFGYDINSTVTS